MFLSIATTHAPATDLGFLLMKHPDRVHEIELAFGRATVVFPRADPERCEAALLLDVDPVALVRGRGDGEGLLDQYVNDRPYAASSFLSVALNRAFKSAIAGTSRERPELAGRALPLEIVVAQLPARGSDELLRRLFEPLGWRVGIERIAGVDSPSRYVELRLSGEARLADALTHLYVLIPVMDADKHYWIGDDEVEKLIAKGGAWLNAHPERETITRRYLKNRRDLVRSALDRIAPVETEEAAGEARREEALEAPLSLHDRRLDAVAAILTELGATSVADLGCGEGRLLQRLVAIKQFQTLVGLDASSRSLEHARKRLRLDLASGPKEGRVTLLHGSLTYRDARWREVDAAALVEVIEHLDPDRLPALVEVVFGAARPKHVVVTTPNADYNILFPTLPAGAFRHPDHRFEFSREEFRAWADGIAGRHGYAIAYSGIGDEHPEFGPVSQVGVFTR